MRRRHGLIWLLCGCGPGALQLTPDEGSALGGEVVMLTAPRLPAEPRVTFDGVEAAVGERVDGALPVTVPAGLAGVVPVQLFGTGEEAIGEGVFTRLPLELEFLQAAAHYLPEVDAGLRAGTLIAGTGLLVADGDGALWRWDNTGQGAFVAEALPGVEQAAGVAALDIDGDGVDEWFVCHDSGEAARVFGTAGEWSGAVAAESSDCRGALTVEVDGVRAVAELRDDGVRLWRVDAEGLERWDDSDADDASSCGSVSASEGLTASCVVRDGQAEATLDGAGTLTWTWSLPSLSRPDDGFLLRHQAEAGMLTVTDAAGETFSVSLAAAQTWETTETDPVEDWTPATADAEVKLPLVSLSLSVSATLPVSLEGVLLQLDDGGRAPVFEPAVVPPELEGEASALVVMSQGLVLGGADGAWLVDSNLSPTARLTVDCAVGALATPDLDGDGATELFVGCTGEQDRLFRADENGYFFDDSAATLPVDDHSPTSVVARDLDLDGLDELVVASGDGVSRLYLSQGDRYVDATPRLSLETATDVAVLVSDVDEDGDTDLLLLGSSGTSRLFLLTEGD